MRKLLVLLSSITIIALPWPALANSYYNNMAYAGLDLFYWKWEEDNSSASAPGLRGRFGYYIGNNFHAELHLSRGFSDARGFSDEDLGIDFLYSVFLRGTLPVHERLHLAAMVGPTGVIFEHHSSSESYNSSEAGFSAGGSVSVPLSDKFALRADYIRYLKTSDTKLDVITAGITWHFN